jgi:hypothetical protein
VNIEQIFGDKRLDGHLLETSGYVSQVFTDPGRGDTVNQQFGLEGARGGEIWCTTTVPKGEAIVANQSLAIEGVVISRGNAMTEGPGYELVSYLACPGIYHFPG